MISIIVGLILVAFTVFACLPAGLNWGNDILAFLKGFAPVLTAFVGLISLLIGISDVKDKMEAKKEEREAQASEDAEKVKEGVKSDDSEKSE
ncbi:MAG: hypothetical protein ACTTHG_06170 [Treponemataceae bacterium]